MTELSQGLKRKQLAAARLEAKALKPKGPSHQSKGVGRHSGTTHGTNGKFACIDRLSTVPLPCNVADVNNDNMQGFFASGTYSAPFGDAVVVEATPLSENHA